jgi:hypothetical protein
MIIPRPLAASPEARLSSFDHPNLNPDGVGAPEPSTGALLVVPLVALTMAGFLARTRGRIIDAIVCPHGEHGTN